MSGPSHNLSDEILKKVKFNVDNALKTFSTKVTDRTDFDENFLLNTHTESRKRLEDIKKTDSFTIHDVPDHSKSFLDKLYNDSSQWKNLPDYKNDPLSTCLIPKSGENLKLSIEDDPNIKSEYSLIRSSEKGPFAPAYSLLARKNQPDLNISHKVGDKFKSVVSAHICNNRSCMNPYHFSLDTSYENRSTTSKETKPLRSILSNPSTAQINSMGEFASKMTEKNPKWKSYHTASVFGYNPGGSSKGVSAAVNRIVTTNKSNKFKGFYNNNPGGDSLKKDLPDKLFDEDLITFGKDSKVNLEHKSIPLNRSTIKLQNPRRKFYEDVNIHRNMLKEKDSIPQTLGESDLSDVDLPEEFHEEEQQVGTGSVEVFRGSNITAKEGAFKMNFKPNKLITQLSHQRKIKK